MHLEQVDLQQQLLKKASFTSTDIKSSLTKGGITNLAITADDLF